MRKGRVPRHGARIGCPPRTRARGSCAVPEGIKLKPFVSDLKEAYEALPKKTYACEMTRTNKGVCYTPGKDVELAFESLLKELRTYSKIQLGDYRRVEFNAF